MTPTVRLLPFAPADGATNMAADEALLETAAEHGLASLRFYTWAEPTLSLGYFQPAAARSGVPNLEGLAWVRRSTGGAAIVHHHELTYALALPAGKVWQPPGESWVCRFHHVVRDVLAAHGVTGRMVVCGEETQLGEVLCFLHQTPGDLTVGGSKVAGSAQRKMRGALLQHGSLLLRRSEFAPELPGINDAAGRELFTPEGFAAELAGRFAGDTGWALVPGDWTDHERTRIPVIRSEKYANPAWNRKR
jgi:lipoate-protein ligase A